MATTSKNSTPRRKPAQERPAAPVVQLPLFAPKPRQTAPQEVQVVLCECGADAVRIRLLPDPAAVLRIMDESFGTMGWTRRYYFADGRLWCGVGYRLHHALTVDKLLRAEDGHIIGVQLLQGERKVVWQAE